ncbi:EAL domain-containing protein [Thalassotalea sp. M1531]|uniref:EAL domain-containing protein n=1 Tax=Thalassotalea algicola TaxID=2716224 RepID=A0A7Y0LGV9_9GAMM|nr:EAL domain-containing protein [Thalassotalea algicola]NMP32995.1 EAL domain-containing protein [Thalassotalea algicola]
MQYIFLTGQKIISSLLILVSLLTISSLSAAAQENTTQLKFKQLTTTDGLSQSYVFSIVQDKHGFMWFATQDGLNRYDGFEFVHYRHNVDDPKSLADNYVRTLFIDSNDNLWVGTKNGLSKYDAQKNNFINFRHEEDRESESLSDNVIWDIYEGKTQNEENEFLVSTSTGLHRFNPDSKTFTKVTVKQFENSFNEVKTIFQDENNDYWLGSFDNGIYLVNQSFTLAKHIQTSTSKSASAKWNLSLKANSLYDMKKIEEQYWLATDKGLYILDQQFQVAHHITHKSSNGRLLSDQIRAIELNNNGNIWLGSNKGINSINQITLDINEIDLSSSISGSFDIPWIMSSFKDSANNIWLGTYGGGIQFSSSHSNLFQNGPSENVVSDRWISSFAESFDGNIWFNNEQGELFFKEPISNDITHIPLPIEVAQIRNKNKNSIWLKSYEQTLHELNLADHKLINHPKWSPSNNQYQELVAIGNSICQIDTQGHLSCYDSERETTRSNLPDGENSISLIEKGEGNNIVLLTDSKVIYSYELGAPSFSAVFSLMESEYKDFEIKHIAYKKDNLWLASNGQGIVHINLLTNNSTLFNESNSLNNSFIADIIVSKRDNLWFATNNGIGVISGESKSSKLFDSDYNLQGIEFISYSSLYTQENDIFFGSPNGYYKFSANDVFHTPQKIKPPVLRDISIANKSITTINEYKHVSSALDFTFLKKVAINYLDFPLSIEFTSPNASLPNQTKYKYRLKGLEESWVETTIANRRATYTNLSPGTYLFEVEVFDTFNPKISERTQLEIEILPPLWLTNSAKFIYGLAAILMVLYFVQQWRHRRQYHLQIKKSEERLKLSLWGSGDEMWDWNIKTKKIFRSNIWGILEFPQDGTRNVGTEQTNIHPNDIPRVKDALNEHFDKKTEHFEITYRVKDKQEQWVWVLDRGKVVERDDKDKPLRMTGTLKDISHIKKAEERLKLFAKCIENISEAVIIYDRQFNIVDVNKSFIRITGKSKASMLGKQIKFNRYPDSFTQAIKKHLVMHGSWQGEIESRRGQDETYYTDLTLDVIRDESSNISHFVGVFSDITARKKSESDLRKLANSDTLTGLPNRSFFQANQQRLVKNKIPHALLVFDLDNFKKINDSMGHQVGDMILIEVAKRIVKIGSKRNSVYRLGGDEFSVIIENTNDIHTITSLAKDILKLIAQPLKVRNQEIVLYSSVGIVLYPEDGATPAELLKNADTAMYHAKDSGGNRYQFFSDSMNKQAVKRMQIETLIRHGLKEDYFSVFYQPKIEIATGKVAGMEALVRFETPTKGIISPVVFIPVSEETGQIIDIGEIVLRKSCYAAKKWVDAGLFDGRVAVNLSAVQFTQPNLPKMIATILEESGLPAKHLELEITEGTVMDSPQQAIDTMLQIRSMGIHLSLDDFGTGYSSLAYLKKFPLNTLKIDKAFVDDIEISEQGRNMVATIVTIAHNLGMQVVAEGVETNNQLSFLSGLACEQLQGYLYSKPLPESEFQKYLLSYQITDQSTSMLKS